MSKVAVIVDSLSCIPPDRIEKYGIKIIPVIIYYKDKSYRDLVELDNSSAYEFLDEAPQFWRSSTASPEDYLDMFRELRKATADILIITVSPRLSAFYQSAVAARETARAEMPDLHIEIIDSETVTAAEGLVAMAAAEAAQQGKTLTEVAEVAFEIRHRVKFVALLDTIRYVYRTGRIPKLLSQIGAALPVKPVLTTYGGVVHMVAATRTRKNGIEKILAMMRSEINDKKSIIAVMHAGCLEEAQVLKERIAGEYNCQDLFITDFSPVMAYATGKGTLALAYYAVER
jgi:DegV family protein with EDD domain